ncbi:hypothetical protein RAS1_25090 [Phycisphaerae bacterium RAS1]|nr:hypothetical protein RAS1_25090 [Phycisphaerae bacterium RAS1]
MRIRLHGIFPTALTLVALVGCPPITEPPPPDNANSNTNGNDNSGGSDDALIRTESLRGVHSIVYQLQGDPQLELAPLRAADADLLVIDYSADGSDGAAFNPDQIAALRDSGPAGKVVLAYMSIGEAETVRFYFDNAWLTPDPSVSPEGPFTLTDAAPPFLAEPNPAFPDNLKVRYWDAEWQQIIIENAGGHAIIGDAKSYLDRIIDAGFDGVYLDIIDAFEYFGPNGSGERPTAASDMIDFVLAIGRHARQTRGKSDFLVFPQNGANIVDVDAFAPGEIPAGQTRAAYAAARRAEYFAAINGIGAEDAFYFGDADEDNPPNPQEDILSSLDDFRAAGLLVLSIEYLTQPAQIATFFDQAGRRGFVPFASVRALDRVP